MPKNSSGDNINLSELENIDFGPSWLKPEKKKFLVEPNAKKNSRTKEVKRKDSPKKHVHPSKSFKLKVACRKTILEEIKKQIKQTGISFSIGEISDTISKKVKHLNIKVEHTEQSKFFYQDTINNRFFISLDTAISEITKSDCNSIVKMSEENKEKPTGNFASVLMCPRTNYTLPPRNYHNFEKIIKDHLFKNKIDSEYSKYVNSLEVITEKSKIDEWKEKHIVNLSYSFNNQESGGKTYSSIDHLRSDLGTLQNQRLIKKISAVSIRGDHSDRLEEPIAQFVKQTLNSSNFWKKDVFIQIIVFLKKNGFHVFKYGEKKNLYAGLSKPKQADENILSKTSFKILDFIKSNKSVSKIEILNCSDMFNLEKTIILKELRWLIFEGYIREFSNGKISVS